jgi:GT2 family glycosyltransferase
VSPTGASGQPGPSADAPPGVVPPAGHGSAERVCAVVVTYNRKLLLRECLLALLAQTRPLDRILVVDNVSTDGTLDLLAAEFPPTDYPAVEVFRLERNVGGAGGFHAGLQRAAGQGFDWIWLLDDDTIARPDTLAELFATRARFEPASAPDLLASKVVWTDGSIHPMNVPRIKRNDLESLCQGALGGALSLRSTSFVACLVHRRLVERYGLPIAEYFIWNDDVEYSARILRHEFGVLAPRSRVEHKTTLKDADPGPRYYYGLRNSVWMLRCSRAWAPEEKLQMSAVVAKGLLNYLRRGFSWARLEVVGRALRDGFLKSPTD